MNWRDLISDVEKIQTTKVNGREFPWKKLTVEQDSLLNNRHKNDEERLIREKILMRMQNADNTVNETDLVRLPEDVYMKLSIGMMRELLKQDEDFQSGVSQENQETSTGSLKTKDTN